MRRHFYLIIPVMLILFVPLITGCLSPADSTLTGADAYSAALSQLQGSDFTVKISEVQQVRTSQQALSQSTLRNVSYNGYGTQDMRVASEEVITIGQQSIAVSDIFIEGIIYLSVNDGYFSTTVNEEQAETRYIPKGLLNPELYDSIQFQYSDDRQVIGFSAPSAAESWAAPQDAQFIDASGTAILLPDGSLHESTYSVRYTYGSVTVTHTATAHFDLQSKSNITTPADAESYIPIANIDAPVLLETACARLLEVETVSANSTYDIYCTAGGLQRTQTTQLQITDGSTGLTAQVDTQVELTNQSQQGTTSVFVQSELFADGNYSITADNRPSEPTAPVTEDAMRSYCQTNLVSSVLLPRYIESTDVTETAEAYAYTFTASDSLAKLLFTNAYQTLYTDRTMSDELADSYQSSNVSAYLTVNKYTGLPASSGLCYTGFTTIEELTHTFRVTMEQNYAYAEE